MPEESKSFRNMIILIVVGVAILAAIFIFLSFFLTSSPHTIVVP